MQGAPRPTSGQVQVPYEVAGTLLTSLTYPPTPGIAGIVSGELPCFALAATHGCLRLAAEEPTVWGVLPLDG